MHNICILFFMLRSRFILLLHIIGIVYNKAEAMLKPSAPSQVPASVLSKDKKTNEAVQRHHFKKQVSQQRNKLSELLHNFQPGFLEPEHEADQTLKVSQQDIRAAVNVQTAAHAFELDLAMGDYLCQYSRNGAALMLASSYGHLALLDWREKELTLELNLRERISAGCFLHNDEMVALCQPAGTFLYDSRGIEIHKLPAALGLQYLPYHFLLALYDNRRLRYYDTTTGHVVADHPAKNHYSAMAQNKTNAVVALGTSRGVVEWWTPGTGTPAVQLFVGGKVDAVGFHKGYMYTAADQLKVWDSRMLRPLAALDLPRRATSIDLSDSGLLALNLGFKVEFWKDLHLEKQALPYLRHNTASKYAITNTAFAPFEDVAGLGTSRGFASIIVPGSGTPFFDSFENNPFETRRQKREALVHKLLERLAPETITVDPNILGGMSRLSKEQVEADERETRERQQREHL